MKVDYISRRGWTSKARMYLKGYLFSRELINRRIYFCDLKNVLAKLSQNKLKSQKKPNNCDSQHRATKNKIICEPTNVGGI